MNIIFNQLEKYLEDFMLKLKNENKSKHTILSYKFTIKEFISFLQKESIAKLENIKPSTFYKFLEYKEMNMKKQGKLSPNSKIVLIARIHSFFIFIETEDGLLNFNRLFNSIKIKAKRRVPKGLDENEYEKLLSFLEKSKEKGGLINYRNALLIKISLFTGLRVSEILNLRYLDFKREDEDFYRIKVVGKGDKERIVYIKIDIIEDELRELLKEKDKNDYIALSKNNKLLKRQNLDIMLKRICDKIEIKRIGFHTLRHTFAKNYLKKGGNIVYLQNLLGHNDIKTTIVYANPLQEDIKRSLIPIV